MSLGDGYVLQRMCSRFGSVTVLASAIIWATVIGAIALVAPGSAPHLLLILAGGAAAHIVILGHAERRR